MENKETYMITATIYKNMYVEANSGEEARKIAFNQLNQELDDTYLIDTIEENE